MPYKSLPLGAFWTIFGRNFPTGVLQLLYPYQPANPLVESIFKALKCFKFLKISISHHFPYSFLSKGRTFSSLCIFLFFSTATSDCHFHSSSYFWPYALSSYSRFCSSYSLSSSVLLSNSPLSHAYHYFSLSSFGKVSCYFSVCFYFSSFRSGSLSGRLAF